MPILAMATLLADTEPAIGFQAREQFLDFGGHERWIVPGITPSGRRERGGQFGTDKRLCRMALPLPERATILRTQMLGPFAGYGVLVDALVGDDS